MTIQQWKDSKDRIMVCVDRTGYPIVVTTTTINGREVFADELGEYIGSRVRSVDEAKQRHPGLFCGFPSCWMTKLTDAIEKNLWRRQ